MTNTESSACCAICGQLRGKNQGWFLLAENRWTDQLMILKWEQSLLQHADVHAACSVAHVQQLVVHWMTTGTLKYPFARTGPPSEECNPVEAQAPPSPHLPDIAGAQILGELAVDRNSLPRILGESPGLLGSLLVALADALTLSEGTTEARAGERNEDRVFASMGAY